MYYLTTKASSDAVSPFALTERQPFVVRLKKLGTGDEITNTAITFRNHPPTVSTGEASVASCAPVHWQDLAMMRDFHPLAFVALFLHQWDKYRSAVAGAVNLLPDSDKTKALERFLCASSDQARDAYVLILDKPVLFKHPHTGEIQRLEFQLAFHFSQGLMATASVGVSCTQQELNLAYLETLPQLASRFVLHHEATQVIPYIHAHASLIQSSNALKSRLDSLVIYASFGPEISAFHRSIWNAIAGDLLIPGLVRWRLLMLLKLKLFKQGLVSSVDLESIFMLLRETFALDAECNSMIPLAQDDQSKRLLIGLGEPPKRGTDSLASLRSVITEQSNPILIYVLLNALTRALAANEMPSLRPTLEKALNAFEQHLVTVKHEIRENPHALSVVESTAENDCVLTGTPLKVWEGFFSRLQTELSIYRLAHGISIHEKKGFRVKNIMQMKLGDQSAYYHCTLCFDDEHFENFSISGEARFEDLRLKESLSSVRHQIDERVASVHLSMKSDAVESQQRVIDQLLSAQSRILWNSSAKISLVPGALATVFEHHGSVLTVSEKFMLLVHAILTIALYDDKMVKPMAELLKASRASEEDILAWVIQYHMPSVSPLDRIRKKTTFILTLLDHKIILFKADQFITYDHLLQFLTKANITDNEMRETTTSDLWPAMIAERTQAKFIQEKLRPALSNYRAGEPRSLYQIHIYMNEPRQGPDEVHVLWDKLADELTRNVAVRPTVWSYGMLFRALSQSIAEDNPVTRFAFLAFARAIYKEIEPTLEEESRTTFAYTKQALVSLNSQLTRKLQEALTLSLQREHEENHPTKAPAKGKAKRKIINLDASSAQPQPVPARPAESEAVLAHLMFFYPPPFLLRKRAIEPTAELGQWIMNDDPVPPPPEVPPALLVNKERANKAAYAAVIREVDCDNFTLKTYDPAVHLKHFYIEKGVDSTSSVECLIKDYMTQRNNFQDQLKEDQSALSLELQKLILSCNALIEIINDEGAAIENALSAAIRSLNAKFTTLEILGHKDELDTSTYTLAVSKISVQVLSEAIRSLKGVSDTLKEKLPEYRKEVQVRVNEIVQRRQDIPPYLKTNTTLLASILHFQTTLETAASQLSSPSAFARIVAYPYFTEEKGLSADDQVYAKTLCAAVKLRVSLGLLRNADLKKYINPVDEYSTLKFNIKPGFLAILKADGTQAQEELERYHRTRFLSVTRETPPPDTISLEVFKRAYLHLIGMDEGRMSDDDRNQLIWIVEKLQHFYGFEHQASLETRAPFAICQQCVNDAFHLRDCLVEFNRIFTHHAPGNEINAFVEVLNNPEKVSQDQIEVVLRVTISGLMRRLVERLRPSCSFDWESYKAPVSQHSTSTIDPSTLSGGRPSAASILF